MSAELLMVIEVDEGDRIRCQAPQCARPVHRRIHVVRDDGHLLVLGSKCCEKLFGYGAAKALQPRYGSGTGRVLSPEERSLLDANTEAFIARIEAEAAAAEALLVAEKERAAAETVQRAGLHGVRGGFGTKERQWVAKEARRSVSTATRSQAREALALFRAQQAMKAAREAVARVPDLAPFPVARVADAMIQAKANSIAQGLKLDSSGSREEIEVAALSLLKKGWHP